MFRIHAMTTMISGCVDGNQSKTRWLKYIWTRLSVPSAQLAALLHQRALPSHRIHYQIFRLISQIDISKMTMPPCPPPKTALGRHRLLSPTASVYVSPLSLGAMNFGSAWKERLGECSKETAFEMLDFFYESGGNFIDTYVQITT